jgi:hypothetical protein
MFIQDRAGFGKGAVRCVKRNVEVLNFSVQRPRAACPDSRAMKNPPASLIG